MHHVLTYHQEGQYSLIHIPLNLYSSLLRPILGVLLPQECSRALSEEPADALDELSIGDKHGFLNISITPIECSIVCDQTWASKVFVPAIEELPPPLQKLVSISDESYEVCSVATSGMDAGSRVMELTAPLALAGVSIFFITTYWTDFIIIPSKDHKTVVQTLIARNFQFSDADGGFVVPTPTVSHARGSSSISSLPPSTPPPSNVAELQQRTFAQLKKRSVVPFIVPSLHLALVTGKDLSSSSELPRSANGGGVFRPPHWLDTIDSKLYLALISALMVQPRFLSLTLTREDQPSLLLDRTLLHIFGDNVAGDTDSYMVPIFLDLSNLPLESTGIVCGVAGKLVDDMVTTESSDSSGSELSYLSTARAGTVILGEEGSARALQVLMPLLGEKQASD